MPPPCLEVGDAGSFDGPDLLELHFRVPEVVEEASTVAEQDRNDVELEFVQQYRCPVLPSSRAIPRLSVCSRSPRRLCSSWDWRHAASGTTQLWSRSAPSPSGFSSLWFGPATKPSREIEI